MATSTIDTVKKLMELALHNPNEAEAASAAMMAVRLIDKFSLPVGDNIIHRSDRAWEPPPQDFYDTVSDLFKGKGESPDAKASAYEHGAQMPGGLAPLETELVDRKTAFAQQVVTAWRAIREVRKALDGEIYRLEQRTGRRFDPTQGRGLTAWSSSRMSPIVGSSDWMFRDDYGTQWRLKPTGDANRPLDIHEASAAL